MNRTVLYKWNISSLLSIKTFVNFLPPDLHSLTSNYIYPLFSSLSFYLPFQEFAFTRMWTKGENPQGRTRSRRRRVKQHPTSPSLLLRVYARRGYFPSECIERQMFSFSCSSMGDDCSARRKFGDSPKVEREKFNLLAYHVSPPDLSPVSEWILSGTSETELRGACRLELTSRDNHVFSPLHSTACTTSFPWKLIFK